MSQIPSTALSAAVAINQRDSIDARRARQVQASKTEHHAEDVAELDESSIGAVGEEERQQEDPDQQAEDENPDAPTKKHLDIKAAGVTKSVPSLLPTHLDLEA